MRLLRRLFTALKSEPAPTLPNRNPPTPVREGQEVWGASRSAPETWREVGRDGGGIFDAESWTPGDRSDTGPGLRAEAVGDVSAVSFSDPLKEAMNEF